MVINKLSNLVGSGAQADVYLLGDKAIKLFKEHCSKQEVFYEAMIHSMVEGTGLPIPKVHEVIQYQNRMAIVMDMVEGLSFNDIIYNDLDNISLHLDTMIDIQIKIHSIRASGFPKMKEKLVQRISGSDILNDNQKYKLLVLLDSFDEGNSLCHGDFHFMNLIKTNKEIKIIDWIDAKSGNPEADICRTYMLFLLYAEESAEMYLKIYCSKMNKSPNDILRWLPVIAGARLDEGNDNEKIMLLKWVNKSV